MRIRTTLLFAAVLLASLLQGAAQPSITAQPESRTVSLGANVTFSVTAEGFAEPIRYQWRRNELPLAGETNNTLTLTNVQVAQAGSYSVIVTDGFEDSVTSEAAILTVDPTFTKITTGVVVTNTANAFGCAWGDYDGDEYLDLIVGDEFGHACALYRNNGDGTFDQVTTGAIATTLAEADGLVWGDYDNDGDLDLFVANWEVPSLLFRNDGGGSFTRIISGSMGTNAARSLGCAWGDYDNDGLLDLIVANGGQDPFFYRNEGNATFTQILSGPVATSGGGTTFLWSDYDNDGALDLFFNRGFPGAQSALLFHNEGGGSFRLSTAAVTGDGQGGGDWGDYDNDGDLDLAVSGAPEPNGNDLLYRNDGGDVFTPIAADGIFNAGEISVQCTWGDYDNDGWLDVFVTHYQFGAPEVGRNNFLFHNNGNGTFARITSGSIVNDGGNSIGCAWGDYDNDGFLDLFVVNGGDEARQSGFLYRNNGNSNRWLSVKCVGAASNRSGIGAKVRVKASIGGATLWQLREISSGNGYNGSGLRAHFGLRDTTNVDLVRIEWPSGTVQELNNVAVNQFLTVTEPARLQAIGRQPDGSFQFFVTGGVGFRYALETSSNLTAWTPWTNVTNSSRTIVVTDPTATNAAHRFYRAVMQ